MLFSKELTKDPQHVIEIINEEEQQFLKTLNRGRNLLNRTITRLDDAKVIPGDVAWRMYDTYGFPIDLTVLMAEEKGLTIDMDSYEKAKEQSYIMSQGKTGGQADVINLDVHAISELQEKKVPATDDSFKYKYTSGEDRSSEYNYESCVGSIIAIRNSENRFVDEVKSGEHCGLILDQTNFYAESGGQICNDNEF